MKLDPDQNTLSSPLPGRDGSSRPSTHARRAFTLIELLVVIAIIAALAALVVGGAAIAGRAKVENRVKTERDQLVGAIESYHKKFGFYPPDHAKNPAVPPWTIEQLSPLYFELTGTPATDKPALDIMGVDGIANSGRNNERGENFHPNLKSSGFGALPAPNNQNVILLVVPYKGRSGSFNPWHYRSSKPEHNTESFDLWAEVVIGEKTVTIGNWKD